MTTKAIIFDYDGVLTLSGSRQGEYAAAEDALKLAQGELYHRLWDGDGWQRVKRGQILEAEYWRAVLPECGLEAADSPHGPLAFLINEEVDQDVLSIARRLRPHYQLALLSNATLSYEARWRKFGLYDLFDVVINSARVGLAKPDREIYELALRELGRTPGECLFIDDKERNTVAAEALDIPSIVFTSAAQLEAELRARGIQLAHDVSLAPNP